MSTELTIISPTNIEEAKSLAKMLSFASLLPDALREKPADVLAIILAGAELGLPPMTALRGIQIIKGKPTLAADTMGALVKRRGELCEYLMLIESTPTHATYETKRKGDPKATPLTFTIEQAQRAGLNGDNWRKYPDAMLRARCLAAICRAVYPDVCLGLYDPDEMGAPIEAPTRLSPMGENTIEGEVIARPATKTDQVKELLKQKVGWVEPESAKPAAPPTIQDEEYDSIVNSEPPEDIPLPVASPPRSPPRQQRLKIQEAPASTDAEIVMTMGKNKGLKLKDIPAADLTNTLQWLVTKAAPGIRKHNAALEQALVRMTTGGAP